MLRIHVNVQQIYQFHTWLLQIKRKISCDNVGTRFFIFFHCCILESEKVWFTNSHESL